MKRIEQKHRPQTGIYSPRAIIALGLVLSIASCRSYTVVNRQSEASAETMPAKIARVLGHDISANDLTGETEEERCRQMTWQITSRLFEAFRQENSISADEAEIADCQAALARPSAKAPFSADLARNMVIQFKIDQQLYQTYAGEVVFQQASPLQPIGAYRAFLREQEKKGRLTIVRSDYEECFWRQFVAIPSFVLPESSVDFATPWWRK